MSRWTVVLLVAALAGCGQRPIETIRTKADFYYGKGEYADASREYGEIADRYPGDWKAQYRLGLCYLELDEPLQARLALELADANHPGDPDVIDALAEATYRDPGTTPRVFEYVQRRAETEQTVRAWLRLARYAAALGDSDSATAAFETAIILDNGDSVEPYLQAAAYAQHIGDTDEAVRRLRQAYTINPTDPRVNGQLTDLGEVPGPTLALPPGR